MDNTRKLEEENILRLLLEFSIPTIVGMLVSSFYNVIDRIFIGNAVGSIGIAAVTIGFPIMLMQSAFGLLIGFGATALVSIKLGEHKDEEAQFIVGNAFVMLLVISIITTSIGLYFMDPMLKLFGASETVTPYAKDFLQIILLGTIFMAGSFGMNNFIRAEGKPNKAMATMLIGTIFNFILAPLFLFVFHWGMKGAALATLIAQGISCVWVMSHFLLKTSKLKLYVKNMKLKKDTIFAIIAIGLPMFAMESASFFLNVIMNKSLEHYGGDIALSGMGAVLSIAMLILMPIMGISQGAQPIIGYNFGAKKYDRVKETVKMAIVSATAVSVIGFIALYSASSEIITLFSSNDKEFIEFGRHALKVFLLMLPLLGFQVVGSNYFQAVNKPKQAIILTLSRQVILLIPLVLIMPLFLGLDGLLFAGPISDLGATIITAIWLYYELKNLGKNDNEDVIFTSSLTVEQ